jgi:serine phosphatase RsbU (regulator of sigma subunit)
VLNRELAAVDGSSRFVTAFAGVANPETLEFRWSSAGHPSPLHLTSGGAWKDRMAALGPPLGIREDLEFGEQSVDLSEGDLLLLYTDGVTELRDRSDSMYGDEGLTEVAAAELVAGQDGIAGRVLDRLLDECGEIEPADDITLVSLVVERSG